MAAAFDYVLEPIRDRSEFRLHRARQRGGQRPLLVVAPTAEQPLPQSLRRLEHEYSLAAELESSWAAKPLALTRHEGRTILVLADPGGEPLDGVLDREREQPLDLARVLCVAINLAVALGRAHQRGLMWAVPALMAEAKPLLSTKTSSPRTQLSTTPVRCGSPASGLRPDCDKNVRCPCRPRSLPGHSPICRRNRPGV
jgi:hypothetical protein